MNHEHMKLYSQKTILCKDKLVVLIADRSSGYFDCIQAGGTTIDDKICSIVWFPNADSKKTIAIKESSLRVVDRC